jgi:hypothetical protein
MTDAKARGKVQTGGGLDRVSKALIPAKYVTDFCLAAIRLCQQPLHRGSTFRARPDIQFLTSGSEKSGWLQQARS